MLMRNPLALHLDFQELEGLLGNVVPSNIDMVLERKGFFLFGEWKRENEEISKGQQIMLTNLAKLPGVTVLIVQGHTDEGCMTVSKFWQLNKAGLFSLRGKSTDEFKDFVQNWFLDADYKFNTATPYIHKT